MSRKRIYQMLDKRMITTCPPMIGHICDTTCTCNRPSDRVQEKDENCALFWRQIVRDKKSIVRVIVRDCAYLFL